MRVEVERDEAVVELEYGESIDLEIAGYKVSLIASGRPGEPGLTLEGVGCQLTYDAGFSDRGVSETYWLEAPVNRVASIH